MDQSMEAAQELMLLGNYSNARDIFLSLLEDDQENQDVLYHLGLCALSDDAFVEAAGYFTRCVELNPGNIDAWVDLGDAYLAEDKYSEAREAYERAMHLNPENPRTVISYAHLFDCLEDYPAALRLYEQAMEVAEPWEAPRFDIALVYSRLGRFLEADIILEGLLTESLRRGAQTFVGDWAPGSREDLADSIKEIREERDRIASEYETQHGRSLDLARLMFRSIAVLRALEQGAVSELYREIRTLQDMGIDLTVQRSHYRLNVLEGSFSGPQLQTLLVAAMQLSQMDGMISAEMLTAWNEASVVF